jgi:hypothetical protein
LRSAVRKAQRPVEMSPRSMTPTPQAAMSAQAAWLAGTNPPALAAMIEPVTATPIAAPV